MKKFFIVITCLLLIVGCGKKEDNSTKKEEPFELQKIDETKDYVYLTKYKNVIVWDEAKDINILTINVKSEMVDNINLEIKNFVINNVNKYELNNNRLTQGTVIDYDYYVTDKYISVIQRYFMTSDDMVGDKYEKVYVVSLLDGKRKTNEELIKDYDLDNDKVLELIEEKLDTDDKDYWMSIIKKNGYTLYINGDSKLCVLLDIETDDELIKKELVLN